MDCNVTMMPHLIVVHRNSYEMNDLLLNRFIVNILVSLVHLQTSVFFTIFFNHLLPLWSLYRVSH
ncbi:hypothetical protein BVRB_1g003120 [Beta vulgaris subsp. vulgaris]|nr:hypothetical protein BVRB_1g003120 [Beta vulgaris subsp. vulgaris]